MIKGYFVGKHIHWQGFRKSLTKRIHAYIAPWNLFEFFLGNYHSWSPGF